MKIVLLGDVGSAGGYHLGDEAMAEAAVLELSARTDVSLVAVSGDPEDTTERYGWDAVPRIGFDSSAGDEESGTRLERVLAAASGDPDALDWADPAWQVIHAVAAADAVVISGGGNLNSTWPEHVYERAALGALAAAFGKPHVVSGQTVGPHLTEVHGELVGRLLTSAALVVVRESASLELARRLGVPDDRLVQAVDDAAHLPGEDAPAVPADGYVAATFSPFGGLMDHEAYVAGVAALLDGIHDSLGLPVVLVPHQGTAVDGELTGDNATHADIASRVTSAQVTELSSVTARQAVAVTRGATLVLSSRYHPVVFALAGSVPAVGIGVDAYTSTKIQGALRNYGLSDFAVSVSSLLDGDVLAAAQDLVARASEVRSHLDGVAATRRDESAAAWDAVLAALTSFTVHGGARPSDVDPLRGAAWTARALALRDWSDTISTRMEATRLAGTAAAARHAQVGRRVEELEAEVAELSSRLAEAEDEIDSLRISTKAAHDVVAEELRPLVEWSQDLPTLERVESERDALYRTRTFRYTRIPRELYRRIRS